MSSTVKRGPLLSLIIHLSRTRTRRNDMYENIFIIRHDSQLVRQSNVTPPLPDNAPADWFSSFYAVHFPTITGAPSRVNHRVNDVQVIESRCPSDCSDCASCTRNGTRRARSRSRNKERDAARKVREEYAAVKRVYAPVEGDLFKGRFAPIFTQR